MGRTKHHHRRRMRWGGSNWWHHMFSERPYRCEANRLCRLMVLLVDIEAAPLVRHYKRDHKGFWY